MLFDSQYQRWGFLQRFLYPIPAKMFGTEIIIHFHNKGVKSREGRWPDKWLYKAFFKNIQIILLAPPLYNDIQKFVKPEQVVYCPNGIPQNVTYDFPRKETTLSNYYSSATC